jgi:O-acetyl-ADP-ribose deacetylase (regulator of RNase III)
MQIRIVDQEAALVAALREEFKTFPEVEISCADMLEQRTDAWVTPTNSHCNMSGGLDGKIKQKLGVAVEFAAKGIIAHQYPDGLPVGQAIITGGGGSQPRWVVHTPTMRNDSQNVSHTVNTALAMAAAFQAIYTLKDVDCQSIAIPGLGTGTGSMPFPKAARLMKSAYELFRRGRFESFDEMNTELRQVLQDFDMNDVAEALDELTSPPPAAKSYTFDEWCSLTDDSEEGIDVPSLMHLAHALAMDEGYDDLRFTDAGARIASYGDFEARMGQLLADEGMIANFAKFFHAFNTMEATAVAATAHGLEIEAEDPIFFPKLIAMHLATNPPHDYGDQEDPEPELPGLG